jgi:hypothetical protein
LVRGKSGREFFSGSGGGGGFGWGGGGFGFGDDGGDVEAAAAVGGGGRLLEIIGKGDSRFGQRVFGFGVSKENGGGD